MRAPPLLAGAALALCLWVASACSVSRHRLDEAVFHEGPDYSLKLVRWYEDYPLHFTGETAVVECRSPATLNEPAGQRNDAGWVVLGSIPALGSKSASELLPEARRRFLPVDEHILVWTGLTLNASWSGCRGFATWDPTTLPADLIDPAPRPDYCKPKGTADCKYEDFQGERMPDYSNVRASADGAVEFDVRSKGLRTGGPLHVASRDFGKTWEAAPQK